MTTPILDQDVFDELAETMGDDFAAELVSTFLMEAPTMLADLREAVQASDSDAYRRAAHSIKSNADVFGATKLAEAARALELGGLEETATEVPALQETFDQTAATLGSLTDG